MSGANAARKRRTSKVPGNVIDFATERRKRQCILIVEDAMVRADAEPGIWATRLCYKLGLSFIPRAGYEVKAGAPRGFIRPDMIAYEWKADRDHNGEVAGYLAQWLLRGRVEEGDPAWIDELTRHLLTQLSPEPVT